MPAAIKIRPPKSTDAEMRDFLAGVIGVVEANYFEHQMLWEENDRAPNKMTWEQIRHHLIETVGRCADMPVCISLVKAQVMGRLLLFVHPTSRVVDHLMIDNWLKKTLPPTALRPGGYVNKVDAMNFCDVFRN